MSEKKARPVNAATLRDVSERAKVSIATASKVANGIKKGVSEKTVRIVQQAIRDLNYRPNRMGRELRTRRNYIVGMAIVYDSPTFLADPYITHLVAGLSNYLGMHDYGLLLHGIQSNRLSESFLVKESIAVALCLILSGPPAERRRYLELLETTGHQPLVVFQENPSPEIADCCFVNQNDTQGARVLAEKIMRRGGQNIFILAPDLGWYAVEARLAAFNNVFDRHGANYHIVLCNENNPISIHNALADAVKQFGMPDLVVGANDQLGHAAYQLLAAKGLTIPEEVGITGFNAFGFRALIQPQLESVQSPAYELGELGGKALLDRLESGVFQNPLLTLPVEPAPGKTLLR